MYVGDGMEVVVCWKHLPEVEGGLNGASSASSQEPKVFMGLFWSAEERKTIKKKFNSKVKNGAAGKSCTKNGWYLN